MVAAETTTIAAGRWVNEVEPQSDTAAKAARTSISRRSVWESPRAEGLVWDSPHEDRPGQWDTRDRQHLF